MHPESERERRALADRIKNRFDDNVEWDGLASVTLSEEECATIIAALLQAPLTKDTPDAP